MAGKLNAAVYALFIICFFAVYSCKDVAPGISERAYCEGCIATITELLKLTSKKTSDPRDLVITEALENICKPYNFVKYDFSPPKTVKACQLLLEKHEEEIESALVKKSKDLEKVVCYDVSKACLGVDRSKKPENVGGVDLSMNGKAGKAEKVFNVDPETGKTTKSKETSEGESKTLSKKDRKSKKVKKSESKDPKDSEKKEKKPDFFHLDVNDPDSINKVMAQIQEATQQHTKEFYRKQEEEETKKEEEEEEQRKKEEKDEL